MRSQIQKIQHRASAFTLVEILVVTGVIAILLAFTSLCVAKAWRRAAAAKCLSNLHQLSVDAASKRATPPYHYGGTSLIYPARKNIAPVRCPSDPSPPAGTHSYEMNSWSLHTESVVSPGKTLFIFETRQNVGDPHWPARPTLAELAAAVDGIRHVTAANYLFLDGHAESIDWLTIQKTYDPNGSFINSKPAP